MKKILITLWIYKFIGLDFINFYERIGKTDYILEINKDEINNSICDLYLNNILYIKNMLLILF